MRILSCCRRPTLLIVTGLGAMLAASSTAHAQAGACCETGTGACIIVQSSTACPGTFFQGSPCPSICDQIGACCRVADGSCFLTSPSACGGTALMYLGGGSAACQPNPCTDPAAPGACCNAATGGCAANVPQSQCPAGSAWYSGSSCSPNPCVSTGACCIPGAACFQSVQNACNGAWYANTSCANLTCFPTGACCTAAAGCQITTQSQCGSNPWFGAGSTCTGVVCGQAGACCNLLNGSCVAPVSPANCPTNIGIFFPNGACTADLCRGVCCVDNSCIMTSRQECAAMNGTYIPNATCTATSNPCPTTGACCVQTAAGGCIIVSAANCPAGSPFFPGVSCNASPVPCPPARGACCCPGVGCHVVPQSQCVTITTGGTSINCRFYPNQACSAVDCPPIGACCVTAACASVSTTTTAAGGSTNCPTLPAGCTVTTLACCCGHWHPNISCSPDPCPSITGACCLPSGACTLLASNTACNGQWFEGEPCNPNPCPRGACCNKDAGVCIVTTQALCRAHGLSWLGAGTACPTRLCPPRRGACCIAGSRVCYVSTFNQCRGTWYGNTPCIPNPCCPPNYTGSGQLAVADIFSFLNAWFAGCP